MRKAAAILLFFLFLFNFVGYKCWYYYLQQRANLSLEARLDKEDYNEKDLIELRVPLLNPYQQSWNEFERVDGEVDIQGVTYKYVKRKVENGQLILLCIPHLNKMHLAKACSEYNGSEKKSGSHPTSWKIVFLSEFEATTEAFRIEPPDPANQLCFVDTSSPLSHCFIGLLAEPPELV